MHFWCSLFFFRVSVVSVIVSVVPLPMLLRKTSLIYLFAPKMSKLNGPQGHATLQMVDIATTAVVVGVGLTVLEWNFLSAPLVRVIIKGSGGSVCYYAYCGAS
jgi:hypothetical protein